MLPDSILPTPEDDIARQLARLQKRVESLERLEGGGALVLIEDINLAVAAADFDFQTISQDHIALKLMTYLRSDQAGTLDNVLITFNNDGGANYDAIRAVISHNAILATAAIIAGTNINVGAVAASTAPANTFDMQLIEMANYAQSDNRKVLIALGSRKEIEAAGNIAIERVNGWWRDNAAITRITISPDLGANWLAGSRATLYGIGL